MSRAVLTIAYFTFLEAARSRLAQLQLLALLAGLGASKFLHAIAITDSLRIQTAFLAATLRPASVFLLSLFIVNSMVREFDERRQELILSLDIPRSSYAIGKQLGFMGIATLLAGAVSLLLGTLAPPAQAFCWGVSLLCELWIMTTLGLFCAITFTQTLPSLSLTLAFYLLARSIGSLQLIGRSALGESGILQQIMVRVVDGAALLLPHLDTFAQTTWLTDSSGDSRQLWPVAAQTLIYCSLLLAGTLFDLSRKNF